MRRISKTPQLLRNFAATSPQLRRNFSAKLLTVLFIFLTSTLFWSCKKELTLPNDSKVVTAQNLNAQITIAEAKQWYEEEIKK